MQRCRLAFAPVSGDKVVRKPVHEQSIRERGDYRFQMRILAITNWNLQYRSYPVLYVESVARRLRSSEGQENLEDQRTEDCISSCFATIFVSGVKKCCCCQKVGVHGLITESGKG